MKSRSNISRYSATVSTLMSSLSVWDISFFSFLFVAVVLSFLASDLSSNRIFWVFRFTPSMRNASSSITAFRYSSGISIACFSGMLILPGQPPLTIRRKSSISSTSPVISACIVPSAILLRDILPDESPDSYSDIGRILILAILPAPLCIMPLWLGVAEPVNINCPFSARLSTS